MAFPDVSARQPRTSPARPRPVWSRWMARAGKSARCSRPMGCAPPLSRSSPSLARAVRPARAIQNPSPGSRTAVLGHPGAPGWAERKPFGPKCCLSRSWRSGHPEGRSGGDAQRLDLAGGVEGIRSGVEDYGGGAVRHFGPKHQKSWRRVELPPVLSLIFRPFEPIWSRSRFGKSTSRRLVPTCLYVLLVCTTWVPGCLFNRIDQKSGRLFNRGDQKIRAFIPGKLPKSQVFVENAPPRGSPARRGLTAAANTKRRSGQSSYLTRRSCAGGIRGGEGETTNTPWAVL